MPLQLGYLLPTRERIMVGHHATDEIIALGEFAEQLGLDAVWIGDSLLAKPRHEPLALLTAIAARTEHIALGTAVLLPMLRNPVLLAHQAATIDQISHGRLILGVGIGRDIPAIRNEFAAAGVGFDRRVGTLLESIALCRALWTSTQPVNWDGRWQVLDAVLAPRPAREGGPPIWGGGGVEAAQRRAGRHFDAWFPSGAGDAADWQIGYAQVQDSASTHGRAADVSGAAYVTLSIANDANTAQAALDAYLELYYQQPAARIRANQYCFAGTEGQALAWLRGFADSGATHLCVRFTGSDDRAQMHWLADARTQLIE